MPDNPNELDLRGVPAPIYLLRANNALDKARPGEHLEVVTDDSLRTILEFQSLAARTGHTLVDQTREAGGYRHTLRRR
jgi:tRNA 2-thiouridine synthesizing protein A